MQEARFDALRMDLMMGEMDAMKERRGSDSHCQDASDGTTAVYRTYTIRT